jgi:hypothetical protein
MPKGPSQREREEGQGRRDKGKEESERERAKKKPAAVFPETTAGDARGSEKLFASDLRFAG